MRLIILSFVLLLIGVQSFSQCPTGPFTLTTQNEVNSFATTYPGCTVIPDGADLEISGTTITDLSSLQVLTGSLAAFEIRSCPNLTSLDGLENITFFGNDALDGFILRDLPLLTSIDSLINLNSITGEFTIRTCAQLTNLNGLNNLVDVYGSVILRDNNNLQSLNGLNALEYIGETLEIVENSALTDISALSNVDTIVGGIEGGVFIENNASLSTLAGLGNSSTVITGNLDLLLNASLSICSVPSICNYLAAPPMGAVITVNTNVTGCNSETEITSNCATVSVNYIENSPVLKVYPTVFNSVITIESDTKTELTLLNIHGQTETLQIQAGKNAINLSHLAKGVYFIGNSNGETFKIIKD